MADTPILMPQLGESVTEGTIAKWFKQPGDRVEKYEALAEVITDKVNAEVPSPVAGVITRITVPEGTTVAVKQEICRVDESGTGAAAADSGVAASGAAGTAPADAADAATADPGATDPGAAGPGTTAARAPAAWKPAGAAQRGNAPGTAQNGAARSAGPRASMPSPATTMPPVGFQASATAPGMPLGPGKPHPGRYSPAVLRLAQEHGVNLAQVQGSGLEGRVTRKDVLAFIENPGGQPATVAAVAPEAAGGGVTAIAAQTGPVTPTSPIPAVPGPALAQAAASGDQVIEPTPVRRRIAERMVQAVHDAPHAWLMMEADITDLVALRRQVKEQFQARTGAPLTYLPFVIKAAVEALREHPEVNSAWVDGKIVIRRHVNISLAVATEEALVVPVIKDADQKSITGLAHAVVDLAGRARAGKLTLDDISGGTFTVDNTGSFGSIASMPILNPPQAAILTFEAIVPRPVVRGEGIAIRQLVNLCMSFDHRVVDGLAAGHFLQAVKRRLENYPPDTPLY